MSDVQNESATNNIVNNHLFGINNSENLNAIGHSNENYDQDTFK